MIRLVLIFSFFVLSCEEAAPLRERTSKPSEDAPDLPGYLDETNATVKAGEPAVISISRTELVVASDTFVEDVEVRLRTLESIPEREEVASLGEAMGDVVEVTVYNRESQVTYPSSILEQTYSANQLLDDVSDEANLKYVVITAPGTDDELVQILSRKAITTSTALTAADLPVSIELSATHVIFYAVESAEVSATVIILDSGGSVSSSSPSNSSSGSSIDCTGLGHDPDNEVWIPVPANAEVGQSEDFCVMKYEARLVDDLPLSTHEGQPTTAIGLATADAKCSELGVGFSLINNAMWQTIARDIENYRTVNDGYINWSNGSRDGENFINSGHTDNSIGQLPLKASLTNPCYLTSNPQCQSNSHSDFSEKRTHQLSNSEIIWDFGGNAYELVKLVTNYNPDSNFKISELSGSDASIDKTMWAPSNDYTSKNTPKFGGLGVFIGDGDQTINRAVIRGGGSHEGDDSGIFSTYLYHPYSFSNGNNTGFRCAYTPQ